MAHYAFLDSDNIVVQVIVGRDENEVVNGVSDWEQYYGAKQGLVCKRTSFNTAGGVHISGGIPFRKNYAGIGFKYDEHLDAFIPPKPYNSWVLNTQSCLWEAPVLAPVDERIYSWDEASTSWTLSVPN